MTLDATAPPAVATTTPKKLGWRQYSGYATGDAANNLVFSMAGSFLLLYYTNVVGLAAASIGTMFLLVRLWDAFADLFAGRLVDAKKPGRLGKFRPFIVWFALPLLLSNLVLFGADKFFPGISSGEALLYAYLTYALMSMLYSLVNIPYGSIAPAMTQLPTERARLASWRVWGSNLAILMIAFVVAPQISKYAHDTAGLQRSLFITLAVFVVLGVILYGWTVINVKEQVRREVAATSLKQDFASLRRNRPLVWLCLGSLAFLTGLTALSTLAVYYATYVLGKPSFIAWNILAQTAGTLVMALFIPWVVRRVGKRAGYVFLSAVGVIAGVALAYVPATVPALAVGCFFLLGVGAGGVNTIMWALEADTVEYGEWKSGVRTEGTTYALFSFTRKMGQSLGGAAGAYALGFVAFNSAAAKHGIRQTAAAVHGIQLYTGLLAAGFFLLSLLIMAFYPLTDKVFRQVVAEITARRARRPAGAPA